MAESYYFSTEKHDNIHLAKNFLMMNTLFFFFLLILKINDLAEYRLFYFTHYVNEFYLIFFFWLHAMCEVIS